MEAVEIAQAYYKEFQRIETFGHLAPKLRKQYEGWVLFVLTAFGDTCIIDFEFSGLESSPWFNVDILDLISDYTDSLPDTKMYGVYEYNGTYRKFKNGSFRFNGKIEEIKLKTT